MCGIAGYSGEFPPEVLERMSRSIAHRGPDGAGTATPDPRTGLASRRLAIIDLSPTGDQPMWDPGRRACVVFNGEIYNHRELRAGLKAEGIAFRGTSDTEVLLALYLRHGTAMLSRLNGIFAFALFDARDRTLFLARDPLGVKPLYFTEAAQGFLFGSELKAILAAVPIRRHLDPGSMRDYLTFLWTPAPDTLLEGIRKLPPGCALRVRDGRIEHQWQYFTLPVGPRQAEIPDAEAVDRFTTALESAVQRQLVSDVPVGAFLSGGVDSSAIAHHARRFAPAGQPKCFTVEVSPDDSDEDARADRASASRVAEMLGLELHPVPVSPDIAGELPLMIRHLEEPQADPAAMNVLLISRAARERDIKVMLSGAGADDILGGYRRHRALLAERYWGWMPRPARHGLSTLAEALPSWPRALRRARKAFQYAHLEGDARLASYFYWCDPALIDTLLADPVAPARETPDPLVRSLQRVPPGATPLDRMLYLECMHFLADHNLNYTDKMSMAAGVEVRVPYLDPELVDLAFRLPSAQKIRGPVSKWVLKRSLSAVLPDDIVHRPKVGFGVPLRRWLHGPFAELLNDTLSGDAIRRRGLFRADAVHRLIRLDREHRIDASYPIFAILCVELWCREFLDRATA